jgi:hypothetical protein
MDGPIQLTLRREPSFFQALAVEGPWRQVLVARERATGRLVGMGTRSVRHRFVEGIPMPVGYLSGLRVLPDFRKGTLLARGYRFLKELHADGLAAYYLTSIASGNAAALGALSGARAGLPAYCPIGQFVTWVIPRRRRAVRQSSVEVRGLTPADVPQLLALIARSARLRQFVPCYTADDFAGGAGTFANLPLSAIYGAWRDGRLLATLAGWDQRAFRQTVVEGYRGPLRWARHACNAWALLCGRPRFPARGACLPVLTGALPFAADQDPTVFPLLLDHVSACLPGDADALLVGLSARDPLTAAVRRKALAHYSTELFVVCWDVESVQPACFQGCVPYLELGCL